MEFGYNAGTNLTKFFGSDQAGDTLGLKCNRKDARPLIYVIGGGGVRFDVVDTEKNDFRNNNVKMLRFFSSGATETTVDTGSNNRDLYLQPHGTGLVKFGTYAAAGGLALVGYITIKDNAGNNRQLGVVT